MRSLSLSCGPPVSGVRLRPATARAPVGCLRVRLEVVLIDPRCTAAPAGRLARHGREDGTGGRVRRRAHTVTYGRCGGNCGSGCRNRGSASRNCGSACRRCGSSFVRRRNCGSALRTAVTGTVRRRREVGQEVRRHPPRDGVERVTARVLAERYADLYAARHEALEGLPDATLAQSRTAHQIGSRDVTRSAACARGLRDGDEHQALGRSHLRGVVKHVVHQLDHDSSPGTDGSGRILPVVHRGVFR
jgi:hypothetical protein